MFDFEKYKIVLSSNPLFFILLFFILILYAVYVYRFTIPAISNTKKTFLVILRSAAIVLLLFVFFEPILTHARKMEKRPLNYIFIDNSRSIKINDGTHREEAVNNFLQKLKKNEAANSFRIYSFGDRVKEISPDSLNPLTFSEGETNFSRIFSYLNTQNMDISSATIVSDGVITDGSNPVFSAEKMNLPVYTVGIGDSAKRNDVTLKTVLYNQFIYAGTPTSIAGTITNQGFGGKSAAISLAEDGKIIDRQNIVLSEDGIQDVKMNYTPESAGEKKLSFSISILKGELSGANNKKIFYINVLSNKVKVLVIAGTPSPDLSFIKNALSRDKNLQINSITQTAPGKFLEKNNINSLIDSADVLFLVGFPGGDTPDNLLTNVSDKIIRKDGAFFFLFGPGTDFGRLRRLEQVLPFTFQQAVSTPYEVQPAVLPSEKNNPLLQERSGDILNAWNNLPPVLQPDALLTAKPESDVLSQVVVNNVPINRPLVLTRKLGRKRSIAVLAEGIWRWGLQSATKNPDLFNSFILNSVKWLNNKEESRQVTIRTTRKNFSTGDKIEFTGQVYDESFNPVSNAEVNIKISGSGETYNVTMNSLGNGLYEGSLETNRPGDYTFTGSAKMGLKLIGKDSGKFNIGETDIEFVNPGMDYNMLSSLSSSTGGKFFLPDHQDELLSILKNISDSRAKTKTVTNEYKLWSNQWLMGVIIFLFAAEWFFRKRFGML